MNNSTIVGLAIGAVVTFGAVVGFSWWNSNNEWNVELGKETIVGLTDDYNVAIGQHPSDRGRATFAFDLLAKKRLASFTEANSQYPEYIKWAEDFEAQCKHLRKAIRKN